MREYFQTEYRVPHPELPSGARYCMYFLAADRTAADALVKERGLGETVESGYVMETKDTAIFRVMSKPQVLFDRIRWNKPEQQEDASKLLHQVCFLLNLGEASGRYQPKGVFADQGLVHQLVHCMTMTQSEFTGLETLREELVILGDSAPEMFYTKAEHRYLNSNAKALT